MNSDSPIRSAQLIKDKERATALLLDYMRARQPYVTRTRILPTAK